MQMILLAKPVRDPRILRVEDWDDTASGRSPKIRWDTKGGPARCPRVNSYDRWFSNIYTNLSRGAHYTFVLSFRIVIYNAWQGINEWSNSWSKRRCILEAKQWKRRRRSSRDTKKYNFRPRIRAFVLLPPSTFFCLSS